MSIPMAPSLNVFGEKLVSCSEAPMTGFFRDGCCNTSDQDAASHTICAGVTAEFLAFSKGNGNDLSTPRPEYGFAGLKPGDSWCLCASRWLEAHENGAAPHIHLTRTHQLALEIVPIETMKAFAVDLN
ncbi:MAG: hypothetical protein ACI9UH_000282 [Gammaproteobacteria bacterium]|jgi:uncharacterized protein (DUF2237 family)